MPHGTRSLPTTRSRQVIELEQRLACKDNQEGCDEMSGIPGEFQFIDWLRRQTARHDDVLVGPGDDAAVLDWTGRQNCLVTTDMLMDGVCFKLLEAGARAVGRKAMAVNLSDIAAMAGNPVAAVVS